MLGSDADALLPRGEAGEGGGGHASVLLLCSRHVLKFSFTASRWWSGSSVKSRFGWYVANVPHVLFVEDVPIHHITTSGDQLRILPSPSSCGR